MPTFGPQATEDLYALGRRLGESFLGRSVIRFVTMAGFDRSIVLSSQAFTALIPLLIVAASLAPADQEDVISDTLIRRFGLTGESAEAVEQLFSTTAGASSSVSALSAALLLFSGISFTRRLQRMYRAAWEQEREGVRSTLYAALGMIALIIEFGIVYGIRSLGQQVGAVWVWTVPVQVVTGLFLWTSIPYLLMNKQVHWRRLLVGGATAALATTAFAAATTLYMPATITRYTNEFGLFGITIAIIGWLLAVSVILVASTAIGAEFDAARDPRVMAIKVRFHLHDPDEDMTPPAPEPEGKGLTAADVLLLLRVLVNWLILSAAVWVSTLVVPGLDIDGGVVTYLAISVLFGLVNAVLGPLLHLVAMPLSVVTLGSFAVVINGVLLATTAGLSESFSIGGLGDAVLGALVIAIVTTTLELVVRPMRPRADPPTLPDR